jgi:hypothetical protein
MMAVQIALAVAACLLFQDAPGKAKASIEKVRTQKSYRTAFTATIKIPKSDPMVLTGEGLWTSGGVLFIHYRASGGDVKRIVRVGERSWVYHEVAEEWATAEELGMNGAGRGVQNPDEVLAVLVNHLEKATMGAPAKIGAAACDQVELKLAGPDIEKIMKEQAQQGSFEWKDSKAEARLAIDADQLLRQLLCQAELSSADPAIKGDKVKYGAEVTVLGYNDAFTMAFEVEDPKTKKKSPVPLSAAVVAAIAAQAGIPKELADEIGKVRETLIAQLVDELGDAATRSIAEEDLVRLGKACVPALERVAGDKDRGPSAKKVLELLKK